MTATRTTTVAPVRPGYRLLFGIGAGAAAGVLTGLALTASVGAPGVAGPGAAVVVGLPVARALLDLAALITVGLALLPKLLGFEQPKRAVPVLASARRMAAVSAAVWLLAALTSLVLETADVNVGAPVTFTEIAGYVRNVSSGQALLIVAGCALLNLVISAVAVRRGEVVPAELRIIVSLFTLLPLPVTGHAATGTADMHDVSMVSMELHVVGAVVWTGGLLAVLMLAATNRPLLADALPRYSKVATVCVFATAVTGVFNGWFVLYETPDVHWYLALFDTGYGRILLLKACCITAAGLLGAHTRFRLMPRIVARQRTAVLTWAAVELAVMGLAFGLAAVLVRSPVVGGS